MKHFLYILLCLILITCQEEKTLPETDVYQIQDLGMLSTTEYTFGKILHLEDNKEWYKLGDRKILISVRAKAKAGVDLRKVSNANIVEKNKKTISITLPAPEIISFDMNTEDVRTVHTDVNGFRMEFNQEEKIKILEMGEQAIRKEMMQSDILRDAEKNAVVFLRDFYKNQGYENVIIDFKIPETYGDKK